MINRLSRVEQSSPRSGRHAAQTYSIGKTGPQATIRKHGNAYFQGLMVRKGWSGRRRESLAVDLAAQSGLTLVAFLRGDSMNVYSRPDRVTQ